MFHFFNKIYLENIIYYNSVYPSRVIGSRTMPHPLARFNEDIFGPLPTLEEYLNTNADGSIDNLWKDFFTQKDSKTFLVYVDTPLELKLKIIYWKSIFKNPNPDILYWLHNSSILERRLKSSDFLENNELKRDMISENLNFTSRSDFQKVFEENNPSDYLLSIGRETLSFEYHLANHFYNPNGPMEQIFQEKFKKIAWKAWYNDVSVMREDLFNSIYDIKKVFPDLELDETDPQTFETAILSSPKTSWLFDADFSRENVEQTPARYSKEVFTEAQKKALDMIAKEPEFYENFQKVFMSPIDNPVRRTELLFDGNYSQFLDDCVKQRFGSIFATHALPGKVSTSLISYILEKVRANKTSDLASFEFR